MVSKIKSGSFLLTTPIAHRGLHSKDIPENSIAAFKSAIAANYAIELDVRLTKDNKMVVFHDDTAKRMCNVPKRIIDMDLEEIKSLRLSGTNEKIPEFKEVLEFVSGQSPLLIEVKNDKKPGVLEDLVIKELKEYEGEFAVQSFNPRVVDYFRTHAENFIRGQLACFFRRERLALYKKFILKRMFLNRITKPDFISYAIENVPNKFIKRYKDTPLLLWTVVSKAELETAKSLNANVIFENPSIFW